MGGLFGRRGGSDFSGIINALRESDRASQNRFLAIMEQNRKSHEEYMKKLNEELKIIQEENDRIKTEYRDEIKKKEEEYEKKQKEKKEKKELKRKQANEQLIKDINISKESILKEYENNFDDMKDIYCLKEIEQIKISDDIEELFIELFQTEKIEKIFLNIILEKIKSFDYNKKINCYNIQIIGKTGVGKSTLINALLRVEKAPTSFGKIGTYQTEEYTSEKFPFIKFIDTRGTELSPLNNINKVEENTLNYIKQKLDEKNPNKTIHCLLYCINSNRFEDIESKVLLSLRKKYKHGNLPIIIVYTQNYFEDDFEEMKQYINSKLKENQETEIGENVEDINIVGVLAKKKSKLKPFGLDKLLKYLKLKANKAFLIATINMIKQYCIKIVEILLTDSYNKLLSNLDLFLSSENIEEAIIYNVLKFLFFEYVPGNDSKLTEDGEAILKKIDKKLSIIINDIHKKRLSEFAKENSEKIGLEIDKTQFNVMNQNLGVKLNIKEHSQFQREAKNDLEKILEKKSIIYSKKNFAKIIYEKAALKFKALFQEAVGEIIENQKEINDLILNLNKDISEDITNKIDNLIEEIKSYQEGEID